MSVLRISLLGGLTLTWDEVPLPPLSGMAARSLFGYLVTHRDRAHTRDLLAGTFWPDLPDAVARRRLSRALWQIRRCLQAEEHLQPVLLTEGDTVQLNPDLPLWLDVDAFRQRVAGGGLPEPELAVELYQGEFLAGYYDDWLLPEREQLQETFLAVLERLVENYKGRGEYERALAHARRLATEAPWREEAHHEVMRLCHLLGRDSEALRQFDTCRRILAEELDTEPSSETVALVREIAEHSGQVSVIDLPKALSHPGSIVLDSTEAIELPLVGREQERAELLAHVQALFQGLGGLVLVEGEAGVGKTRLLQTVARDAEWRGAEVLWGAAQAVEASIPYGPLAEALAEGLSPLRAGQLEQLVDRIWLQVLAPLLPSLVDWLPDLPPAPQIDPAQERGRLVSAVTHFLAGWRRIKPLVVVLENLHWTGEDTLDLLARLAPTLRERGVLLIGSYRGEDARALPGVWQKLQTLDRAGVQHRLALSGLEAAATGELVRRSLGLGTPAPLFETRLHRETEGNPLFVLETLRALYSEGLLARDADGQWSTPWDEITRDYAELPLPRAVEQTIARRLAFLSPELQQMVHLTAVLGERFDFNLLLVASDEESPSVLAALGELVQRRFLDETARDYRFSHDKIRQVAYAGIETGECSLLHRQVAQALEAIQPERVAALAYHWTGAEVWDKAAQYHRQAGNRAQAMHANAEAVAHYSQALEALGRLAESPDPTQVFSLRLAREEVCALQGQRVAQAEDLTALEALSKWLDSDDSQAAKWQAEVALRQARYAEKISDYPAAIVAAQQAIRLAQSIEDANREASGYLQWGQTLLQMGDFETARLQLSQTAKLAQEAKLHQTVADGQFGLGVIALSQSEYAQARSHFTQALGLYREVDDPGGQSEALMKLGRVSGLQGDWDGAQIHFAQALRVFDEIGDRQSESGALWYLGDAARQQGDHARAKSYYECALRIADEIGDRKNQSNLLQSLGALANHQCEYSRARAYFEQALAIRREIGDRRGEARSLTNLGIVLYCQGNYGQATSYAEQARHINREIGDRRYEGWDLHTLGRISMQQGDYARARTLYEQGLHICQEIGARHLESSLLIFLSLLAHYCGDDGAAREHGQQALFISREIGLPVEQGYALTFLGHALGSQECLDEACEAYEQAVKLRYELCQHSLAMEPQAGLARIALAQGDITQARIHIAEILAHLEKGGTPSISSGHALDGTDEPFRVYLTCYRVLHANHDPRAEGILHAAHSLLQERAAQIIDEKLRRSFLENVEAHREIVAAYHELQASKSGYRKQVRLPCANAPTGRPLRDEEHVTVTWTVNAPGDNEICPKTARRRHRILRLLAEAQAQGAAPRDKDLAEALSVSLPTIRRDMATLRAEGHTLPTRGRK